MCISNVVPYHTQNVLIYNTQYIYYFFLEQKAFVAPGLLLGTIVTVGLITRGTGSILQPDIQRPLKLTQSMI